MFSLWHSGSEITASRQSSIARENRPKCQQSSHAIRIFTPHHTTASAIKMQVAVNAFSKADEAIDVLSFAYPDETLCDSVGVSQDRESRSKQPARRSLCAAQQHYRRWNTSVRSSMLSRGSASLGVVGSTKAVCGAKRARPSVAES
jgi:hypothetical protein